MPADIIRDEIKNIDEETLARLPKRETIKRGIRRLQGTHLPPPLTSFEDTDEFPDKYVGIQGNQWLLQHVRQTTSTAAIYLLYRRRTSISR